MVLLTGASPSFPENSWPYHQLRHARGQVSSWFASFFPLHLPPPPPPPIFSLPKPWPYVKFCCARRKWRKKRGRKKLPFSCSQGYVLFLSSFHNQQYCPVWYMIALQQASSATGLTKYCGAQFSLLSYCFATGLICNRPNLQQASPSVVHSLVILLCNRIPLQQASSATGLVCNRPHQVWYAV